MSLVEPEHIVRPEVDCEGRFMSLVFSDSIIVNTYVPTLSLDLTGKEKKAVFWKSAEERYTKIVSRFPDRPMVWVGDMNVAPLEKATDTAGIRRGLERTKFSCLVVQALSEDTWLNCWQD